MSVMQFVLEITPKPFVAAKVIIHQGDNYTVSKPDGRIRIDLTEKWSTSMLADQQKTDAEGALAKVLRELKTVEQILEIRQAELNAKLSGTRLDPGASTKAETTEIERLTERQTVLKEQQAGFEADLQIALKGLDVKKQTFWFDTDSIKAMEFELFSLPERATTAA